MTVDGLIDAVGPLAPYILAIAYISHILTNFATLSWAKRPSWFPPLTAILLGIGVSALVVWAKEVPFAHPLIAQVILAGIIEGILAVTSAASQRAADRANGRVKVYDTP